LQKNRLSSVLSTFVVCYVFWLLLTWSFSAQELVMGAVVCLCVAWFASRMFIHEDPTWLFKPQKLLALLAYIPLFLRELWKANVDMAKRCFGGCRSINPGIIKVPVEAKGLYAQAMLANSITLTPGTITVFQEGDHFLIHCLHPEYAEGIEDSSFIRLLRKMK
jgi:multicomponent Na+:H+ antiporter subunit E